MKHFQRGVLLNTSVTKRWSQERKDNAEETESAIIFTDFTIEDEGKSRKRVCVLDTHHPDFEQNRSLIEAAPDLLEALQKLLPAIVLPLLGGEPEAVEQAKAAIAKALGTP